MKKPAIKACFFLVTLLLATSLVYAYELPTTWKIKFNNVEQIILPEIDWDPNGGLVQTFTGLGDGIEDNWGIAQITSIMDRESGKVVWSDGDNGEHLTVMLWGLDVYQIIAIDTNLDNTPDDFKVRLKAANSGAGMTIWLDNATSGTYTLYNPCLSGSGPDARTGVSTYPGVTDGIKQGDFVFMPGIVESDCLALTQVDQDSLTEPFTGDGSGYLDAVPGSGPFADIVNTDGFTTACGDRDVFLMFDFRPHPDSDLTDCGWTVNSEDPAFGTKREPPEGCRVTGGGVSYDGDIVLGTYATANNTVDRNTYQFGGQVGAPTSYEPQPYGEWTHHQQKGPDDSFIFHAGTSSAPTGTKILTVSCSDPGFCNPARPAPFKQISFEGIGTFKNVKGALEGEEYETPGVKIKKLHYFRVHIEDIGEAGPGGKQPKSDDCTHVPGTIIVVPVDCENCADVYQIEIRSTSDPNSEIIYTVGGFIKAGNLQLHPPIL